MYNNHIFKAEINWQLNEGENTQNPRNYSRNHEVKITNKQTLQLSAAKSFKGDTNLLNPEDLLLTALTSCHMMSYLYVCSLHKIEVLSYLDNSEGVLELVGDGGSFKSVDLNPVVIIKNTEDIELAKELHSKANELCFIANSCNFPITHNAKILVG